MQKMQAQTKVFYFSFAGRFVLKGKTPTICTGSPADRAQKKYAPTREIVRNLVRKFCNTLKINVFCGGSRIRTGDPMLAKHVLYQLSYTPEKSRIAAALQVGPGRVELPTSTLSV